VRQKVVRNAGEGTTKPHPSKNVNIPRGWLEFRVTNHARSKDTPIVVYCGGNIRSPLAAHTLQQMGYTHVKNYADGFISWRRRGLPVE